MPLNLTQKILKEHLVEGKLEPGSEIGIKVDQALIQDATGTMVWAGPSSYAACCGGDESEADAPGGMGVFYRNSRTRMTDIGQGPELLRLASGSVEHASVIDQDKVVRFAVDDE